VDALDRPRGLAAVRRAPTASGSRSDLALERVNFSFTGFSSNREEVQLRGDYE
jgi:hypothetical protein